MTAHFLDKLACQCKHKKPSLVSFNPESRNALISHPTKNFRFFAFFSSFSPASSTEDEHIPPLNLIKQPRSKWDDEDVDENDVKESWEDEDEPAPAPAPPAEKPTEKAPKEPSDKATDKKGKKVLLESEEPLDPLAEKLRQQRLVEEADYRTTKELFGGRSDEKNLDNFIPKSESDFLEYAELISQKIRPFEKSYHYMNLLKSVMRLSVASLKGSDAKEIASSVTAIANEKLKAEKEANASKKKTGGKKKQLHLDKPDEDLVSDPYSALDDYDEFM